MMLDEARSARIAKSVGQLAGRWTGADRRLLRHVFPMLAEGRPVAVERIAEQTAASRSVVEDALERGRAGRDSEGRIVELSGLMLSPSLHRVKVGDVVLFSCCALLAHLTPLLLDAPITLESVDPHNRGLIRLELTPTKVLAAVPPSVVGSFVETGPLGTAVDIGMAFCSHVHHFTDRESATAFARGDVRRFVVELAELRAAAEDLYQAVWGSTGG